MVVRRSGALAALGEEEFSIIVLCSKGLTLEDSLSDERERERVFALLCRGFLLLDGCDRRCDGCLIICINRRYRGFFFDIVHVTSFTLLRLSTWLVGIRRQTFG